MFIVKVKVKRGGEWSPIVITNHPNVYLCQLLSGGLFAVKIKKRDV
jgi:hypothetical protein